MRIILASNNQHKVDEFKKVLFPLGYNVISLKEAQIEVEPDENGKTFKENALTKCLAVSKYTNDIILSDDSGLEIHALNNFPGIYSARFMEGHPYTDKFIAINEKLNGKDDKSANFNCTLCLYNFEKNPIYFEGKCEGLIIDKPRGNNGFGYDPIFYFPLLGKTFAELSPEEKNSYSHRGEAIKLLVKYLKEKNFSKNYKKL